MKDIDSKEEFEKQYMQIPIPDEKPSYRCGDCVFFINGGCSTSYLENKYGNANTPACKEDFKLREK